jgi:hypothetical protein
MTPDLDKATPEGDGAPESTEIEVTPEMIEAGCELLLAALREAGESAVVDAPHEPFGALIDGNFDMAIVVPRVLRGAKAIMDSQQKRRSRIL